jgi:hypothetical protein
LKPFEAMVEREKARAERRAEVENAVRLTASFVVRDEIDLTDVDMEG